MSGGWDRFVNSDRYREPLTEDIKMQTWQIIIVTIASIYVAGLIACTAVGAFLGHAEEGFIIGLVWPGLLPALLG